VIRYINYKNNYRPKILKTEGMKFNLKLVENGTFLIEILV